MGLERVLCVINGVSDIYQTELFSSVIARLESLSGKRYADNTKAFRVIADHIRAAVMIIGDQHGVGPSNTDQGYVVRKLIRRAVRFANQINCTDNLANNIASIFVDYFAEVYGEIKTNKDKIITEILEEENKFKKTLENGLKEFNKYTSSLTGTEAFGLYQSFGFPLEMTMELAREKGFTVDEDGFNAELAKHQELSRTASAGKFKGGLADASEDVTKLHTATHLLQAALRQVPRSPYLPKRLKYHC
jgi:alanyl-tRNA synthetase